MELLLGEEPPRSASKNIEFVTATRSAAVDLAISGSFGFGGQNAVLVLARS